MKINLKLLAMSAVFITQLASACPVTITNDTKKPVFLYDMRFNKEGMLIKPGKTAKFGSSEQHLHFCLMTEEKGPNYQRACIIEQRSCSKAPLKYSVTDLIKGNINLDLFEKPVV